LNEIALALGLDVSSYTPWAGQNAIYLILRTMIRWSWLVGIVDMIQFLIIAHFLTWGLVVEGPSFISRTP
jgi:hypothetical protein